LTRSKRNKERDLQRRQLWKLKRQERLRMLAEGFWDREHAELVSLGFYPLHDVSRGDVLFDQRSYLHPALAGSR
jgi:ribosomal protein L15E